MTVQQHKSTTDFLKSLDPDIKAQVEALRGLIKSLNFELTEHIKWNAPSYVLDGEDRITFSVANKDSQVKLVIHMGANRKENKNSKPVLSNDGGIVQWSSDIRGYITFTDIEDVRRKSPILQNVLSEWLAIK